MKTASCLTVATVTLMGLTSLCMDSAHAQDIDASKPTNFYPLLDNSVEYNARDTGGNLFGYRAQIIYPPSDAHLFLAEVPLLYNDASEKFGVGDLRLRYFFLPYKDYDKFFGAFGPSVDISAPTGSFENGLGSNSWVVAPGATAGFMFADWIQSFLIVSYQYVSKPTSDLVPDEQKRTRHGLTIQALTSVVFSDKFFMQITPIYSMGDFTEEKNDRYIQEVMASYALTPTLQASAFWRGVFADKNHTFRVGLTVFFVGS
jgi:hypothetical protein